MGRTEREQRVEAPWAELSTIKMNLVGTEKAGKANWWGVLQVGGSRVEHVARILEEVRGLGGMAKG